VSTKYDNSRRSSGLAPIFKELIPEKSTLNRFANAGPLLLNIDFSLFIEAIVLFVSSELSV
jgi:hypothetical protein